MLERVTSGEKESQNLMITEDKIAANLLANKTCDTCWHGNGQLPGCKIELDIVHEAWLAGMRQKRAAGIGYEIRDDNDYASLRKPRPLESTCEHWERDHPYV
jgi:hypothetical protein